MVPKKPLVIEPSMVKVTPGFIVQILPGSNNPLVIVVSSVNVLDPISQASPIPSPSVSVWSGLAVAGQLSTESRMPSPSVSGSHTSTG